MKILKWYTKNLHCPEASVVERYVAEEAIAKPVGFPSLNMMKEWKVKVQEDCMLSLQV